MAAEGDPPGDRRESREGDYRLARVMVAGGMTFVLSVLLLLDGINPAYTIQPTTLTVLVTMIAVLLGIEATKIIRR